MTLAEEIGERIRTERRRKRLPMRMLADRAGLSKSYASDIERGIANPTIDVLEQLASVLGIDCGALFGCSQQQAGMTDSQLLALIRQLAG